MSGLGDDNPGTRDCDDHPITNRGRQDGGDHVVPSGREEREILTANGFVSDTSASETISDTSLSTITISQSSNTTQATDCPFISTQESSTSSVTISSYDEDIDIIDEEQLVTSTDSENERAMILQDLINCRLNYRQLNQEAYHEVAAVVNHTVRDDGSRWYKIRWEGYGPDSDSWVRSTDLNCPRRLAYYFYLRRLYQVQPMDFSESDSSD